LGALCRPEGAGLFLWYRETKDIMKKWLQRIEKRETRLGVIGLGYVGLPLAVEFARVGFHVMGYDLDAAKVKKIHAGESYVEDVPSRDLARYVKKGLIEARTDFSDLAERDALIICVPTPLRKTRDPDISYIVSALDEIAPRLRKGQLVILESTTYPGTTEEVILPRLEETGLKAGKDFWLAFSPERVDPGNAVYQTRNTPKVVGGHTPRCLQATVALYGTAIDTIHPVSSTQTAEMVKLLENTFRAVNIALVNEVALMCERLGIEVWEVIDAAATKPFGFMPFYPGPGLGGHCIPIDPHYLSWKLKTLNYYAKFIELAAEINGSMPEHVVEKVAATLNEDRRAVAGSEVLVLGAAYKRGTSDVRESPALDVMELLSEKGATVRFYDPHVREVRMNGRVWKGLSSLGPTALKRAHCTVIVTDHPEVDYRKVVRHARRVVDTRNATKGISDPRGKVAKI
jgi:UDP-N-acetyl-D-glucosamine dehydrogenase